MAGSGPLSGFRDMLPEQMIPRNGMLAVIQAVYERYGFTPIQTPAIERASTLVGKYGEEGDKLMYRFKDHGGRDVALRYDMTVPLARFVGQYAGALPLPFKRYVVGQVWRGERAQAGRYREFTQFDADIVGSASAVSDAEVVSMISDAMAGLGADSLIRVNNRRILDALAEKAGVAGQHRFIATIDKVEKVGADAVFRELAEGYGTEAAGIVRRYLAIDGTTTERLTAIGGLLQGVPAADEGIGNLQQVFGLLEGAGYDADKVVFDPTIARGLDYYTGIIYETTLKGVPELGSMCSGGRYDRLIQTLGGPDLPAVGMSIGVDRLYDGLQKLGLLQAIKTPTQVLVANFEPEQGPLYMRIAHGLRSAGIATEVYYEPGKLGKQLKFADRLGIPMVIIVGPSERERGAAKVRSMLTGAENETPLDAVVTAIKEAAAPSAA